MNFLLALVMVFQISCLTARKSSKGFAHSYNEISSILAKREAKVDYFFKRGPLEVKKISNLKLPLDLEYSLDMDLFLPVQEKTSPLLIFQHGNRSSKEYHSKQADLAASWGFTAMTIKQPNRGEWLENGKRLKRLTELLSVWPSLLKKKFNPKKIILVGHSFGGSAIAIASGHGAPVSGLIFLDPALVHNSVKESLKKISVPAIILGADEAVFKSRRRTNFYQYFKGPLTEISISGATHNDAQFPNMFEWKQAIGLKPNPQEKKQQQFAAAIVAAAFSLAEGQSAHYFKSAVESSKKISIKKMRSRTNK